MIPVSAAILLLFERVTFIHSYAFRWRSGFSAGKEVNIGRRFQYSSRRYASRHICQASFDETARSSADCPVDTSSWQSHPERQSFPRLEIEKARVTSAIKRGAGPCVACVYHNATVSESYRKGMENYRGWERLDWVRKLQGYRRFKHFNLAKHRPAALYTMNSKLHSDKNLP